MERRLLLSGTLPSFVQASTDANYTLDNSSGSMVMDLNSGSMVVTDDLSKTYGWANATVRLHNGARIYFNAPETLGDLELHDTSTAALALTNASTASSPLPYGNFLQLNALAVDSTATLDLGNNSMILYYPPSQEAADNSLIYGLLASGYQGEAWSGTGVDSSAAAEDSSRVTALGFADNHDIGAASFDGISLSNTNQILVRYTVYGDTNLDGTIDRTDSIAFSSGLGGSGTGWDYGDLNYDGSTTQPADSDLLQPAGTSISSSQYAPGLQIQALPFTAHGFGAWSGDVATFSDTVHGNGDSTDYSATVDWNNGTPPIDAQVYKDPFGNLRVNIDSAIPSDGAVFTVHVGYDPNGLDHYIGAASSASAVVTLDQLPFGAVASPDAIYSAGPGIVNVTAGTVAFNTNIADDGNVWQNASISASGSAHLIFNSAQTLGTLTLSNSATVSVSQGSGGTAGNLLQLNSLLMSSAATLDLGDNSMILYNDEAATVQSLLTSGYNAGAWNGPGIISSAAAVPGRAYPTSLGWLDNTLANFPSFAGVSLPDFNQILVGYTLAGDADLNGVIGGTDLSQAIAGRDGQGTGWMYGDYNYSGVAGDDGDFSIVVQNSGKSLSGLGYIPVFQLTALPVQPNWNTPFDGDIATFTDTVNSNLPASDYVAQVYWGDGSLSIAQVTATDTPGSFRINAVSPVFTTSNPIMLVTIQYSADSGYQSESALAGEPIQVLQLPPGVNPSADAVYSISGGPGDVQLNLSAGSLTFDTNVSKDSNYFQNLSFTVSGSAHAYFNSPENFNNLTIQDNAIVTLSKGSGGTNGNLLDVQSLSIDPNATLDLSDNALIDWYAFGDLPNTTTSYESEAATQMSDWLKSGYASGAWTGPGIDSSVAAVDTTHATGVGWMDNGFNYAALNIDLGYSSYLGVSLPTQNQLLVRFAYYGDANLDGQVDSSDSTLLSYGYNGRGTGWVFSDFNIDGTVTSTDIQDLDDNYGLSTTSANYVPAFQPTGILINPIEGVPFSGDLAAFTDLLNPTNADPSIYQAQVNWGDGSFVAAQVTATATPGSFRINAVSPALTDPNALMTVTIQYADMNDPAPTYQGRIAAVTEPIDLTPALSNLVAASVSTSEIDLTWTLNASNASAIEVDRSTDGTTWQMLTNSLSGNATSYADTGLDEATQYYYRISAIWSAGPSAFTVTANTWTLANAPSGLTGPDPSAPPSDSSATLSWTDNSNGLAGTTISVSTDGINFSYFDDVPAGQTTYTAEELDSDTMYWFYVAATTPGGDSAPSDTISVTTTSVAAPSNLQVTINSDTDATLNWTDNSSDENGFEIDWSTDGSNFQELDTVGAGTTTYDASTLTPGTSYTFRVSAIADAGQSDAATSSPETTLPPAPTGFSAVVTGTNQIQLAWDDVAGENGFEVDGSGNNGASFAQIATVQAGVTTYTDNVSFNASYDYYTVYRVRAIGQSGDSGFATARPNGYGRPTGVSATREIGYYGEVDLSGNPWPLYVERSTDGISFVPVTNENFPSPDIIRGPQLDTYRFSSGYQNEFPITPQYAYATTSTFYTDFSDLPQGTVISDQYGGVTFSTPGGGQFVSGGDYSSALIGYPNGINLVLDITFSRPASDVSFRVSSVLGDIDGTLTITQDGSTTQTTSVSSPFGMQTIDLTSYSNITKIEYAPEYVGTGIDLDSFQFHQPRVTFTAYRTGDNFGTPVSDEVKQGGDPSQYVILTNNNFDEHPDMSQPDDADDTALIGTDHDLAKITLHQLPSDMTSGTAGIQLSDPSSARLFKDDGTELTQTTLDLSNPSGYLAGLLNGDVNVWVEGLKANPDLTFKFGYQDAAGHEMSRDTIHMTVADWNFVDKAGDTVTQVEKDSEQLLLDDLSDDPSAPQAADDVFFKNDIAGLSAADVQSLSVTSDSTPDSTFNDQLVDDGSGGVRSADYAALYTPADGEDDLTTEQTGELQSTDQINVVHNPDATEKLETKQDSFSRTVAGKSASYTVQDLYNWLTSDPGYGDKVKFVLDRMDWKGDGSTYAKRIAFQSLTYGRYQAHTGWAMSSDGSAIFVDPNGTQQEIMSRALDGIRAWAAEGVQALFWGTTSRTRSGTMTGPPAYFASIARQWARSSYWQVGTSVPIGETFTGHPNISAYVGTADPARAGNANAARDSIVSTLDFLYFFSTAECSPGDFSYDPGISEVDTMIGLKLNMHVNVTRVGLPEILLWVFSDRTSIFPGSGQNAHFAMNIPSRLGLNPDYWEASPKSKHDVPSATASTTFSGNQPVWPDEDQLHHFVGFFWLGMFTKDNPTKTNLWAMEYGDVLANALQNTGDYPKSANPGDYELGTVAYDLGRQYQTNPGYTTSSLIWKELGMTAPQAYALNGRTKGP